MIWQLPKKKQKKEVTINSNCSFYLNGEYKPSGTYTAFTGDTIKVYKDLSTYSPNILFSGSISFNGKIVQQFQWAYDGVLNYSFVIDAKYSNIVIQLTETVISSSRLRGIYDYTITTS